MNAGQNTLRPLTSPRVALTTADPATRAAKLCQSAAERLGSVNLLAGGERGEGVKANVDAQLARAGSRSLVVCHVHLERDKPAVGFPTDHGPHDFASEAQLLAETDPPHKRQTNARAVQAQLVVGDVERITTFSFLFERGTFRIA